MNSIRLMRLIMVTATLSLALTAWCQQPANEGTVLFYDNFDSGASNRWRPINGTWGVTNGVFTVLDAQSYTEYAVEVGDNSWSDYVVDVDVIAPGFRPTFAIMVRSSDTGYVRLEVSGGSFQLTAVRNGKLVAYTERGYVSYGDRLHIKFTALGDNFIAQARFGSLHLLYC